MKAYDVVALGELLIDFTTVQADGDGYPTMAAHPGGAPGNFLAALAKYGNTTAFLGKVGADAFGDLLVGTLKKANIDTSGIVRDSGAFTTMAFVTLDDHGERAFSFARKPGADTMLRPEELDFSMLDGAKVFHFGSLSLTDEPARTATERAVDYAKRQRKLITFDPNLREHLWQNLNEAKSQMLWGLRWAHVAKLSDQEVEFLFGCAPEDGADRLLEEFGIRLAMVTLGADGCILKNRTASFRGRPPKVTALDTTGAGDIFGGSAVHMLLELGKDPGTLNAEELEQVGRFALAAASLSTTQPGGISSVPERSAVEKLMGAEKPR